MNEKIYYHSFLDTTVFEQLYHLASEEIKETSGKLKEYKKTDFGSIIKESDDIIIENQDTIIELEKNNNVIIINSRKFHI